MMILRTLSLLFFVAVFSFAIANQELFVKYIDARHLSADVSEVAFRTPENDFNAKKNLNKPTFMQVEKINQHELPAQARIGYLLSRGF